MDRVTRAKIDSLIYEVRNAASGTPPWDPEALARRYQLDPMIVRALLESEGVSIDGAPAPAAVDDGDPNGSTQVMNIDELGPL